MNGFRPTDVKWPYVTHLVQRTRIAQVLPPVAETSPGQLMLGRVAQFGKHREIESIEGRKVSLFTGDVIVGVLGARYATDQFEGAPVCSGTTGHMLSIGGVVGEVVSRNDRMPEPTVLEWVGRLADSGGRPLNLRDFRLAAPVAPHAARRPRTILSVGASMNAGKTTTAAQAIYSLTRAGRRVAAAKITGTACRKDPNLFVDAGAVRVLDFTSCGYPSTADHTREQLLETAADLRAALLAERPDDIVYEIADGVVQRETRMLLEDPGFRATIDVVTYAAPDSLSCESGVRLLRGLGYNVIATAGPVANSRLGVAEVEALTGIPCLSQQRLLEGALVDVLEPARAA